MANGVDDFVVVDRGAEPGGVARTIQRDGFSLEPAVGSFTLPSPGLSPILERANVDVRPAEQASTRHVFVAGRLVGLAPSPRALLAPGLSVPAKLRALAEPLVRTAPGTGAETVTDFCTRRFGESAGRILASLMASGVFAGDPESLSAAAAFPMLAALEDEHGSVIRGAMRRRRRRPEDAPSPRMHVPVGGMAAMSSAIVRSLGSRFVGEFAVESVRRESDRWVVEGTDRLGADAAVLAVRPAAAADLLGGEIADDLRRLESAPVAVLGLGGAGPETLPPGFGALIGPDEGMVSVGVLFESSYAPSRAPDGSWLVKVIAGGARHPEIVEWEDGRLVDRVSGEMKSVIGAEIQPDFVEVVRHRAGIPQYTIGHRRWLAAVNRHLASQPGLHLAGWGYRGVGIATLARDAARLAAEVNRSGVT